VLEAFLIGVLASSTLVLGALVVSRRPPSPIGIGYVMAFGAGMLLSAVSFELVEEAATVASAHGSVAIGFFAGAITYFVGDRMLERTAAHGAGPGESQAAIGIVLGMVLDGIPESAVLGLMIAETGEVGMAMLVAVLASNLAESIAATSGLAAKGWSAGHVNAMWVGIAIACALACAAGFALLDDASPWTISVVLAFAGGAILCMLTSTMVPESYERAGRAVGLVATLGFAVAFAMSWVA